ncbi:MAG TPA: hypothetical protein VGQ20_12620, partial [Acidimicrobiales bacterium]|nr:hypothetical protein [Acidimicrobiales bacterium]
GRGLLDHPHAVSLLTYHAQVFHLCAVALYLGEHTLGGSAILMWVPAAAMTAVHWSNQRTPVTAVTAPTP